jgi:hypothetical protein
MTQGLILSSTLNDEDAAGSLKPAAGSGQR